MELYGIMRQGTPTKFSLRKAQSKIKQMIRSLWKADSSGMQDQNNKVRYYIEERESL